MQRTDNQKIEKRLYTVIEAAFYLGRSIYSVRNLIWSGEIPFIQEGRGGKIWLDIKDLDNYIDVSKGYFS